MFLLYQEEAKIVTRKEEANFHQQVEFRIRGLLRMQVENDFLIDFASNLNKSELLIILFILCLPRKNLKKTMTKKTRSHKRKLPKKTKEN